LIRRDFFVGVSHLRLEIIGELNSERKPQFFVPRKETIVAKLTDKFIRSLQVSEGEKDVQVFDDKLPQFGVRKFASGKTSFFFKYSVRGQQRRRTLGPFMPGKLARIRKEADAYLTRRKRA
jgi:hypothetical protein